ncbi:SAM-dependent methyltransferase [Candidatus Dojkabacteria bacterium HGW-Dojkabacteria-1]|uniref:SAM-dependent methyltransferase n=1 Tax=Candidatus Dojkabacteria bacterium HGW-Dojkabacteria-1 TaxID=2013761 RepID=A0A2N2F339_9BACT|nr:MAG: SAM-dependent methyltransferase [Candidatus Dojkabacteria bacterium HGW-Dojkabacteria-1]
MKELIKKILGKKLALKLYMLKKEFIGGFATKIYSQEGEDIILSEFFPTQTDGFYVDIGAHHPMRFSNTYMFYKRGWRGLNLDAMPDSMKAFNRKRPRDINLEVGVSGKEGEMTYYMFDDFALNGFSKDLSKERDENSNFEILEERKIKTSPLSKILDEYLPENQKIDFMSIDVEGLDLMVLKSNDWGKYLPSYILVESIGDDIESIIKNPIYLFLKKKQYTIVAKTYRTLIFKKTVNE